MPLRGLMVLVGWPLACLSMPAAAQDRWPVSTEITLGFGAGWTTGAYLDNDKGPVLDLLLAVRLASLGTGSWVGGATFGVQGSGPADACDATSSGECLGRFPEFTVVSLLSGWETRSTRLRLLTGPAAVRPYGDWDVLRFAWSARVDAITAPRGRLAAVGAMRILLVPSYQDARFTLMAFSIGLRLR